MEKINLVPYDKGAQLPLFVVDKHAEINGIEMGVLQDGTPFLTESGLAKMCGVDRKSLNRLSSDWSEEKYKPRGKQIAQLLGENSTFIDGLCLESFLSGRKINAYPEEVCMAILEYYAFLSSEPKEQAIMAFRSLARASFRGFIYHSVGYNPKNSRLDIWKYFHDRLDLTTDATPRGFWCVFREIAGMLIPLIKGGVSVSDKVVPDISAGKAWSEYWVKNNYDDIYGKRQKFQHNYPEYYPQSKSNPQPAFAYPDSALAVFREWFRNTYIQEKLPKYLKGQIDKKNLNKDTMERVLLSLDVPVLSLGSGSIAQKRC